MLPASFGDSLVIEFREEDDPKYVLIDGGPYYQFDNIMAMIKKKIPKMKEIELLVITHVDIDHIDGIIRLINHDPPIFKIKNVWFNNYKDLLFEKPSDLLGGVQGEYLSILMDRKDMMKNTKPITIHRTKAEINIVDGLELTVINPTQSALKILVEKWDAHLDEHGLSHDEAEFWEALNEDFRYEPSPPDLLGDDDDLEDWASTEFKEDTSEANRSSIAFIASYKGVSCLMSADATSRDLKDNLKNLNLLNEWDQLQVDAWKISHHGSKKSTQGYLTKMIQTKKVLVSSDGKKYKHPDKETIAKLIMNQDEDLEIYFNYTSAFNEIWKEMDLRKKNAAFNYPDEEGYMKVSLI